LENKTLQRWWEDVDKHLNAHIRETPITNTPRVLELKATMDAVTKMKKDFHRYVRAGERAATKIGNKSIAEKLKLRK
jgi:hypothetical protein